ncbi:Thrombospondin-2 [Geodia barretti]|uniref:Thrombospondin-2 n=1 Tax=Geodia barretti TaxID=519541 RepID=A0AA35R1D9_GEOBA|nr:Thrombospondin-2 [Geodia barretti]
MWKLALISLAVVLSTVQGHNLGVQSWNRMLAEIMQTAKSGTCEAGACFVRTEDNGIIGLKTGDDYIEGCTVYRCTQARVEVITINCPENIVCADNQKTIMYPGGCCVQCEAQKTDIGVFTEWEEWTQCTATCGGGRRARKRECIIDVSAGSVECTGTLLEAQDCNTQKCPVPCRWEYGEYEECSATCGDGIKLRFPKILQPPQNGGEPCPPFVEAGVSDEAPCNVIPCGVPCQWRYEEFGACTKTCGGGTKTRFPVIRTPAQHGGDCPQHVTNRVPDIETCNTQPCPIPCDWEWGEYGDCTVTCGGGTQTRVPRIITPAQHGGHCPQHVIDGVPETTTCNTATCPPTCPNPGENNCLINGVYKCIHDPDKDCIEGDNCELVYNPDQKDMDRDGVGDACDNCKFYSNPNQENSDDDETGNECDADDDNDGVVDQNDNCQTVSNMNQVNSDRDNFGDACDNCPRTVNNNQADVDKDGVGNACDNCRFYKNPEQNPSDPVTHGARCTTRPQRPIGMEEYEDEDDNMKSLAADILEKLMQFVLE